MADSKRQNMAGRIATPKVGPAKDAVDGDSVYYSAVGARIRVTVAPHDKVLEGTLFTACKVTNAIAINTAPPPPDPSVSLTSQPGDYHIIPFAHIISFEVLSRGDKVQPSALAVPKVDYKALMQRVDQTILDLKKQDARRGKGVTTEAQDIFNHIARMLPTRWAADKIVVNDAVIIEPPYGIENIKAAKGGEKSLTMVQNMVKQYNQKKGAAGGRGTPVATPPIAPRKGG